MAENYRNSSCQVYDICYPVYKLFQTVIRWRSRSRHVGIVGGMEL